MGLSNYMTTYLVTYYIGLLDGTWVNETYELDMTSYDETYALSTFWNVYDSGQVIAFYGVYAYQELEESKPLPF